MTSAILGCFAVLMGGLGSLSAMTSPAPRGETISGIGYCGGFLASVLDQPRAALGITFDTNRKGVVVKDVYRGLPADKAGIMPGDTILRADGKRFGELFDFIQYMRMKKPGDAVSLVVKRGEKAMEFKVQLVAFPSP